MQELDFNEKIYEEELPPDHLEEIEPSSKKKRKTSKKKNYINNADFYRALVEYRKECDIANSQGKPDPKIPDYIGKCWIKLAEGISKKPNFFKYTYKQEMISDGILNCIQYWKNFDPEKSNNPFSYFSTFIHFAFIRRIKSERVELYCKYKSVENFLIHGIDELLEANVEPNELYSNISEFIEKIELSELKRKEKLPLKKEKPIEGIENFL